MLQRPGKPGQVGAAEPFLALAVEDVDETQLLLQSLGDLARPVRGVVVDHQDAVVGAEHVAEGAEHRLQVLALVVSGKADAGAHA